MRLFKTKDEKMIAYMMKKYGEKFSDSFEIISEDYAGWSSSEDKWCLKSVKMPRCVIKVKCLKGKYMDNYMVMHFLPEYQKRMQPVFESVLGECKLIAGQEYYPTALLDENISYEEFIHSENTPIKAHVLMKNNNLTQELCKEMVLKLKELNIPHEHVFFSVLDNFELAKSIQDYYDLYDYENDNAMAAYRDRQIVFINRNFEIREIRKEKFLSELQ